MIDFYLHGYGEFDAQRKIGPCTWPHFDLLFIHKGHVSIALRCAATPDDDETIDLRGGQAVLIYRQTAFAGQSISKRSRASVQHFGIRGASRLAPPFAEIAALQAGFRRFDVAAGRAAEPEVHRAMRLAAAAPSPLRTQLRIATLTLILAELFGVAEGVPCVASDAAARNDFDNVLVWAAAHLADRPTVDDLAARAGFSPSHFRSIFVRRVGRSAGQFLIDLRLREAERLLRETGTPIKRIARLAGYSDTPTFYRAFTTRHRLTPSVYRARNTLRG